jgi:phage tail-like protein
VFRNASQWEHGLAYRLRRGVGGGLELFSRPSFSGSAVKDNAAFSLTSVAVDACGRMFWVHRHDGHLYSLDPANGLVEPVALLPCTRSKGANHFGRMVHGGGQLWILDRTEARLLVLDAATFQIINEVPLSAPIDIALGSGRVFTLDAGGIQTYDLNGNEVGSPRDAYLSGPAVMAADAQGRLYVVDSTVRTFLRFTGDATYPAEIGRFDDAVDGFIPNQIAIDSEGTLFVSDGSPVIHEFSSDGGYVGGTGDVGPFNAISALTFDPQDRLYAATPGGVARFERTAGLAGNTGVFYTRKLDVGGRDKQVWHRMDFAAELTSGGVINVNYASSDQPDFAQKVEDIFSSPAAPAEKVRSLEAIFDHQWKGPQTLHELPAAVSSQHSGLRQSRSHSLVFGADTKRYLWLKIELAGLTPRARAALREMRAYYPRLSYLRYLPAVYQQDPASREFLERFLALFETVLSGFETTIEKLDEVFDPMLAPREFLDWLAQWLDLGMEEEWPDTVKRAVLANAARLFRKKGTAAGLREFIRLVTGKTPVIQESFETENPFILHRNLCPRVSVPCSGCRGWEARNCVRRRELPSIPSTQRRSDTRCCWICRPTNIAGNSVLWPTSPVSIRLLMSSSTSV